MPFERPPAAIRRVVAARSQGYCEYCRSPEAFATKGFTVEHIKPRNIGGEGGETVLENLAWSCIGCNSYKHTKTQGTDPKTGQSVPLFNPRTSSWNEHFFWSDDFCEVAGETPCGRATKVGRCIMVI